MCVWYQAGPVTAFLAAAARLTVGLSEPVHFVNPAFNNQWPDTAADLSPKLAAHVTAVAFHAERGHAHR